MARIGEERKAYMIWVVKKNERNRVPEDLGVDGKYVFYINRMGGSGMD